MHPQLFTVEYNGTFTTVRTCGGPIGAFHGVTGEKPKEWEYVDSRTTIVNGHTVKEIK